jgi:membrane associated rhomboid family serine protease
MFPLRDSYRSRKFPVMTIGIILVNVFVFLLEVISPDPDKFIATYALTPNLVNFQNLGTLTPFITNQFLHAGFLHILSNMWFLRIFGDNVEEEFGSFFYLIVYLFAGTVGGLLQYMFLSNSSIPMLGASGAVAGVLGAYLVFFPHHKIETLVPMGFFITTVDIPASVMLVFWFFIQLFSGVGSVTTTDVGGVAFWAHVGGFATGYLIAKLKNIRQDYEEGELYPDLN